MCFYAFSLSALIEHVDCDWTDTFKYLDNDFKHYYVFIQKSFFDKFPKT